LWGGLMNLKTVVCSCNKIKWSRIGRWHSFLAQKKWNERSKI